MRMKTEIIGQPIEMAIGDQLVQAEGMAQRDRDQEHDGEAFEHRAERDHALAERGESITLPTVAHELDRASRLDAAGGESYLAEIAGKYFTAIGVEAHARIIARDALYRLDTMVAMANLNLPERAIRQQIASAVNLIVQITRLSDGTRKVTAISEITGMENDVISLQDIFLFEQQGIDAQLVLLRGMPMRT